MRDSEIGSSALDLPIAGEPMRLLADRALFWPARQRLLIADLHLGKSDAFRAWGIAVPSGGTAHDLSRLQRLLQQCDARELWILGDFLHAAHRARADAQWRHFRESHPGVAMAVVPGNHDRAFDPQVAGIQIVADGTRERPFEFRHAPRAIEPGAAHAAHVICGHLHPVLRLPGVGRLPAFWLGANMCVLPAFSAFTGGLQMDLSSADQVVVCNGRDLHALSATHGVTQDATHGAT